MNIRPQYGLQSTGTRIDNVTRSRRRTRVSAILTLIVSMAAWGYIAIRRTVLSHDLFMAIAATDVPRVRQLLASGASANSVYHSKRSTWDTIMRELGRQQSSDESPPEGDTALLFVFDGRPPNTSSYKIALREYPRENVELIIALLRAGASANAVDCDGKRALDRAIDAEQTATCGVLLDYGADPNGLSSGCDPPLARCADSASGTDYYRVIAVIDKLLLKGARVDQKDNDGRTALQKAAWWNVDVARALLKSGANPNTTDRYGHSPLSVVRSRFPPDHDMINLLISFGAHQ